MKEVHLLDIVAVAVDVAAYPALAARVAPRPGTTLHADRLL